MSCTHEVSRRSLSCRVSGFDLTCRHIYSKLQARWPPVRFLAVSPAMTWCAIVPDVRLPSLCAHRTATRICNARGRHCPGFSASRMCRWIGIGENLLRADLCIVVRPHTWEIHRVFIVPPIPNTSRRRGGLKSRRFTRTRVAVAGATGPGPRRRSSSP